MINEQSRNLIESRILSIKKEFTSTIEVFNIASGKSLIKINEENPDIIWIDSSLEWCKKNVPEKSQYGSYRDVLEYW